MSDFNHLVTQNVESELKNVENSIRDLIAFVLERKYGPF